LKENLLAFPVGLPTVAMLFFIVSVVGDTGLQKNSNAMNNQAAKKWKVLDSIKFYQNYWIITLNQLFHYLSSQIPTVSSSSSSAICVSSSLPFGCLDVLLLL